VQAAFPTSPMSKVSSSPSSTPSSTPAASVRDSLSSLPDSVACDGCGIDCTAKSFLMDGEADLVRSPRPAPAPSPITWTD
jgi:hypothetical protein